jgi:phage-related protein
MATTPSWPANIPISYESQSKSTPRIMIAKFGDGYEQRSPDWINNLPREISIKVDQTRDIVQQLQQFLASTKGSQAFLYTPYDDTQGTFVADQGWQVTEKGYDYALLEVTIREVFELY